MHGHLIGDRQHLGDNLAVALNGTDHGSLVLRTTLRPAAALVPVDRLASNVGLVDLHLAGHRPVERTSSGSVPQAMQNEPS